MSNYKDDSDRFHELRDQRDRDLAEAQTWEDLVRALEARGVDVEKLNADVRKLTRSLDKLGVDLETKRHVGIMILRFQLGISDEPSK